MLVGLILFAGCSDRQAEAVAKQSLEAIQSPANKDKLQHAAQVIGNGLKSVRQTLDDAELQGKVYARISWDKLLQGAKLSATARPGGVVDLSGSVPSAALRDRALDLVANTVGVREVVDKIAISPAATAASAKPAGTVR